MFSIRNIGRKARGDRGLPSVFRLNLRLFFEMELGFVKADSRNLPDINHFMVAEFFSNSDLYVSAEMRAVKNQR